VRKAVKKRRFPKTRKPAVAEFWDKLSNGIGEKNTVSAVTLTTVFSQKFDRSGLIRYHERLCSLQTEKLTIATRSEQTINKTL
jgi:hypothetical protein